MMTLQQISDRLEIEQLSTDYSDAIDRHRFDDLDRVFTPDAYVDYSAYGAPAGPYPEIREFLRQQMPKFGGYHHIAVNHRIRVDGDRATGRVVCFNPMEMPAEGDSDGRMMFLGLWYVDEYVRTAEGWRISRRVEEPCWSSAVPMAPKPMAAPA